MYFLFTEDFKKYLNMSSNEEIDYLLKCLSEDIIQDENMISQEDIQRLCAEIDFEEEIPEKLPSNISTTATTAITAIIANESTPLPLSDITLGDDLNLRNILDNDILSTPLENILTDNVDFNYMNIIDKDPFNAASFDLEFDLDAILDHTDISTQEVSAMATELEKVSEHLCVCVCVCVCVVDTCNGVHVVYVVCV